MCKNKKPNLARANYFVLFCLLFSESSRARDTNLHSGPKFVFSCRLVVIKYVVADPIRKKRKYTKNQKEIREFKMVKEF